MFGEALHSPAMDDIISIRPLRFFFISRPYSTLSFEYVTEFNIIIRSTDEVFWSIANPSEAIPSLFIKISIGILAERYRGG